jgi:hypothetical protein
MKQRTVGAEARTCIHACCTCAAIPACRWQPFRWFTYSCNGFHEEANEKKYGGIGNLWKDVMQRHAQQPYHLQVRMADACRP